MSNSIQPLEYYETCFVYLAAPFFTPEHVDVLNQVMDVLESIPNVKVHSPSRDGIVVPPDGTTEARKAGFDMNITEMVRADVVVGCVDYKDTGTTFEIGFSYANNTPICAVALNPQHKKNLMLAESYACYATDVETLKNFVTDYKDFILMLKSKSKHTEEQKAISRDLLSKLQLLQKEYTDLNKELQSEYTYTDEEQELINKVDSYKKANAFVGEIE